MRRQTLALVIVGVLLFIAGGGIAFVTVMHGSKNSGTPTVAAPVTTPAVVVTANVPAGTTGQDMVAKGLVAVQSIPQKKYVSTDLPSVAGLTDEVLTTSLTKGQAIQSTELTASTSSISLPTGLDAVSVTTTGVAGLAGYLEPGSNVDVYANIDKLSQIPDSTGGPVPSNTPIPCTELIMSDIQVLDVSNVVPAYSAPSSTAVTSGTASTTGRSVPSTLTVLLAVTPAEAQTITFMTENETLSVAQTQSGTTPPPLDQCVGTGVLTTAP